jgi:hypothetical protein
MDPVMHVLAGVAFCGALIASGYALGLFLLHLNTERCLRRDAEDRARRWARRQLEG